MTRAHLRTGTPELRVEAVKLVRRRRLDRKQPADQAEELPDRTAAVLGQEFFGLDKVAARVHPAPKVNQAIGVGNGIAGSKR